MNRIDSILSVLNAPTSAPAPAPTTKVASENLSPLDAAIESATSAITGSAKTASAAEASPVGDLLKLANEIREADQEGEIKLAHRMGSAFTDGMVERAELYRQQAVALDKTAGYNEEHAALEKFAAENPAQYAALVSQGFFSNDPQAKLAAEREAADFDAGFIEKTAEIHDLASNHFLAGYAALEQALQG